jgi:DNA-binding NarL/FixJ family response regulator
MHSDPFEPGTFVRPRLRAPSLTDLRVTLVDDALGLETFCEVLRATGAMLLTASSYAEAIASAAIRSSDVLIANVELPGACVRELERMVGSVESPRACIALTRRGDGTGLDDAWRAGFRMCVRTPCDPHLLASATAVLGGFSKKPGG